MKNQWPVIVMLSVLMALPYGVVRADEGGSQAMGDANAHHEWKDGPGHGHPEGLGLTDDQKTKLKTMREAQEKAMKPLRRKQRDLVTKLSDQVEDQASDSDIQRTLSDIKSNREAIMAEAKRFGSQRDALFTPTQKARMILAFRRHFRGDRSWEGQWGHEKMEHQGEGWKDGDHDGGNDHREDM